MATISNLVVKITIEALKLRAGLNKSAAAVKKWSSNARYKIKSVQMEFGKVGSTTKSRQGLVKSSGLFASWANLGIASIKRVGDKFTWLSNLVAGLNIALKTGAGTIVGWASTAASSLGKVLKTATLVGAGYAAALTAIVISNGNAVKSMVNMSTAFGINTTDLQKWGVAAKSVGFEADKIGDIFKDIQDKIGDFAVTGGGAAKDIFESLNLDIKEFIGLSPDKALLKMVEAMDGLPKQKKIFFLEALASDVSLLLPLLEEGGEGFKKLAAEAEKAGLILNKAEIQGFSRFNNTVAEMGRKIRGFGKTMSATLAPAFDLILTKINDYVEKAGGMRNVARDFAVATVKGIVAAVRAISGLIQWVRETSIAYIDLLAIAKSFWFAAKAVGTGGISLFDGGKFDKELQDLSDRKLEIQLAIANKSEVQEGLEKLAKEIELTLAKPLTAKDVVDVAAKNTANSLNNLTNTIKNTDNVLSKEKKIGAPGDRSLNEQLFILKNLDAYTKGTLEGVDKFDAKKGLGVSELIIDGNKGQDSANIAATTLSSQKTAEAVTLIAQKDAGRTSLGQLTINMVTDVGKVAGEIFGEPAFLADIKALVDRQTNDSARQAAGG